MNGKTTIVNYQPLVLSLVDELCLIRVVSFFLTVVLTPCISHGQTVRTSYAGLSGYNVPL